MGEVKVCGAPGCKYIAVSGGELCAVHEEAERLAASAILTESGSLGIEWCEVPGCSMHKAGRHGGMDLCEHHARYFVATRGARFWKRAAIAAGAGGAILAEVVRWLL